MMTVIVLTVKDLFSDDKQTAVRKNYSSVVEQHLHVERKSFQK